MCEPFPLVQALARHGRNLTGVTCVTRETVPKRLELFKEAAPKAARVASFTTRSTEEEFA